MGKLIDDNKNEEVEHDVLLDGYINDEIDIGIPVAPVPRAVEHDPEPVLTGRHAEQQDERLVEVKKVSVVFNVLPTLYLRVEEPGQNRKDEVEQKGECSHIEYCRQSENHCLNHSLQILKSLNESQQSRHSHYSKHPGNLRPSLQKRNKTRAQIGHNQVEDRGGNYEKIESVPGIFKINLRS